jgi:triosephosphate isomerase
MTSQTNGQYDRTPLIAGNWKMNMDHAQAITLLQKLAWTLDDAKHDYSRAEVAVFPPFTDLRSVQSLVDGDDLRVVYGAQDLSDQDSGAYTGDISGQFLAKLGCTYEPVWAIGTGEVAGPEDAQEMAAAIRAELAGLYDDGTAAKTRILYGGSAKAANAGSILKGKDVDGVLVGGASLDAEEFASIARFEQHLVTD